jgi:hypothetical protein
MEEQEKERMKKTFIGLHIQVKQIQEVTKTNKYITDFTLDTQKHRKCSPNGPCLSLCFYGTRTCRRSADFMTGPK